MTDPFASPKRRLTRAKEHVANLQTMINGFSESKPYARVVERNVKGFDEHKIRLTSSIPDGITDIAYEAIEALRSVLDQALYPIAVACGAKRPDLIHFPIVNSATDLDDAMRGRLKDLQPDILSLLRSFKPYLGGNNLIWALNQIRRQAAHRLLIPVGVATVGAFVRSASINGPWLMDVLTVPKWDRAKNEMICIVTGPGAEVNYDIDISLTVTFGEVEGVAGHPVIGTLDAFSGEVERILMAIEAEARRLGLIV